MPDLLHRVVWTFIEAFLAVLIAVGLADATTIMAIDASVLDAGLVAGIASVAVVVKEEARKRLGKVDA